MTLNRTQWKKKNKHPKRRRSVPWKLHTFLDGEFPRPPPLLSLSVSPDFLSVRSDSSWLALSRKLTAPDWWPSADTDLSPAVGSEGSHTHKKRLLSFSAVDSVISTQAWGGGGSGTTDRHKGNKHQQQSLQEIPVQDGCAKKGADCHLKMNNGPDSVLGLGRGVGGAAMWLIENYEFNCWDAAVVVVWGVLLLPSVSSWSGWKEKLIKKSTGATLVEVCLISKTQHSSSTEPQVCLLLLFF